MALKYKKNYYKYKKLASGKRYAKRRVAHYKRRSANVWKSRRTTYLRLYKKYKKMKATKYRKIAAHYLKKYRYATKWFLRWKKGKSKKISKRKAYSSYRWYLTRSNMYLRSYRALLKKKGSANKKRAMYYRKLWLRYRNLYKRRRYHKKRVAHRGKRSYSLLRKRYFRYRTLYYKYKKMKGARWVRLAKYYRG
jgi:hypothetical protein